MTKTTNKTEGFDYRNAVAQAVESGPNMNEPVQGGGNYTPPPEGWANARFIGYYEYGKHEDEIKGEKKTRDKVALLFELSGPKHSPEEGKEPYVITIFENLSLNEKANFFKLFRRMNYTGDARHIAELLGREYRVKVIHKVVGEGADKKTYVNLRDDTGYTVFPPFVDIPVIGDDGEPTGETNQKKVTVAPAIRPIKCFIWDYASKAMWDDIFIDGQYEDQTNDKGEVTREGRSKNVWQERIKSALNFKDSPMGQILFAGGEADIPDAEKPKGGAKAETTADEDPLANIS